ncbi:MAG: gamma-glutamyl-gamma-aminobutyrate hydrolase family protein [Aggregatilineales bacterium]
MNKPLIGLTCTVRRDEDRAPLYGAPAAYVRALETAGGLPVLIPPTSSSETLRAIYERVDGVLLIGGGDIDPELYGVSDNGGVELRSVSADRDTAEIALTRWAAHDDKPLFGICRGIQVMNVALGGTLYRHIPSDYQTAIDHDLDGVGSRRIEGHTVTVSPGTILAELLGQTTVPVNSMHHQAIQALGTELTPVAIATDGLVEAVERHGSRFFVGVQWHPEELYEYSAPMRRLFEGFIRQSAAS